jgi:ABC-type multidrug transport system permease subunit
MLKVPMQFEPRSIFYKQQDANFFPTWSYVAGRSLAGMPTSIIDGLLFGTIIYWFVGLAWNDGASIGNYFIFILLILAASFGAGLLFSIFSATVKDKPTAQAAMSVAMIVLVLFSGFTVQPDVIPRYVSGLSVGVEGRATR